MKNISKNISSVFFFLVAGISSVIATDGGDKQPTLFVSVSGLPSGSSISLRAGDDVSTLGGLHESDVGRHGTTTGSTNSGQMLVRRADGVQEFDDEGTPGNITATAQTPLTNENSNAVVVTVLSSYSRTLAQLTVAPGNAEMSLLLGMTYEGRGRLTATSPSPVMSGVSNPGNRERLEAAAEESRH